MQKQVKFHDTMQGLAADHNNVQIYVRQSQDTLVFDAINNDRAYAGFEAEHTATNVVTLASGRLYKDGQVYGSDEAYEVDLFSQLPLTTKKIIAVVVSGAEIETDNQPRKFLIDAATRATQVNVVPTLKHRAANISTISGTEGATPQKPTVADNLLIICWVTLGTGGVESIEMNIASRLDSVLANARRIAELETWRDRAGQNINTLASDLTALNAKLSKTGDRTTLFQIAADVARLKELMELEDDYVDYGADRYLDTGESDTTNVNYLAKVEEGVRFSDDAANETALALFNQYNTDVNVTNGFMLPKYTDVLRLAVEDKFTQLNISNYAYQTVGYVQRTRSRTRIRYGSTKSVCTNTRWWKSGNYDPSSNIFRINGETWELLEGNPYAHDSLRLRQFWYDTYDEPYWDRIVSDHTINGSMIAQTFLNAQDGWMTKLHLPFTQIGETGDVTILLAHTEYGKPDLNNVIASVTLDRDDMKLYPTWTEIAWPETFLKAGQRYSLVLITGGSHYVGIAQGTQHAQGTLFYSTDGDFFQGDLTQDIMCRIYTAQFQATRLEVELQALSLSGGITDIDILSGMIIPQGTELKFEIQPQGGAWTPLAEVISGNNALYGLPPLIKLRLIFLGTKDVMPGIELPNSRVIISRPRTTFKHISTPISLSAPTQTFKIRVLLEEYYETNHNLTCTINDITNADNDIAPATITDKIVGNGDDANHKNIERTFEWSATELPVATSEVVIVLNGATTSALDTFHVSERIHLAF